MIASGFRDMGMTEADASDSADVVVVNTCTVTSRSDSESRQLIRKAAREHPGARVIVTGCYSERARGVIEKMGMVDGIVPSSQKLDMKYYINTTGLTNCKTAINHPENTLIPVPMEDRSRSFLKIQDGCNNRCTYCAVWLARGESRSVPGARVVSAVQKLEANGCPEVVLTGVHVGLWGSDIGEGRLSSLIGLLLDQTSRIRFRISSIEPGEIDEDLIRMLALEPRVCRHLHVPLQAANDAVLERMGRKYSAAEYFELVDRLVRQVPGLSIGTDLISGFPGETRSAFESGFSRVANSGLAYLHAFPYSRRPGTVAAEMSAQVPVAEAKARVQAIRALSMKLRERFYQSQRDKRLHVVFEDNKANPRNIKCISDNYVRFSVPREYTEGQTEGWVRYTEG